MTITITIVESPKDEIKVAFHTRELVTPLEGLYAESMIAAAKLAMEQVTALFDEGELEQTRFNPNPMNS